MKLKITSILFITLCNLSFGQSKCKKIDFDEMIKMDIRSQLICANHFYFIIKGEHQKQIIDSLCCRQDFQFRGISKTKRNYSIPNIKGRTRLKIRKGVFTYSKEKTSISFTPFKNKRDELKVELNENQRVGYQLFFKTKSGQMIDNCTNLYQFLNSFNPTVENKVVITL
jgi:hypothetical protein